MLFYAFHLFFHEGSPPARLYHTFGHTNYELVSIHVGSQLSQTLFPHSANPDKKAVAPLRSKNPREPTGVLYGVREEDHPHLFPNRELVVL